MNYLTMFADAAPAAAPAAEGAAAPNPLMSFLPLILIFGVFIFFTFRSQKKQQQKRQEMLDKITKGTKVLLNSGMIGVIVEVKADSYIVEIADKVKVEVVKAGVGDVMTEAAAETK